MHKVSDEQDLIPYTPSPLRGERLLVLAPHPDDEVIGCGGLLALHRQEKRQVKVVVATDGRRAEGEGDEAYVSVRELETNRGLELLDVENATFLKFADRALEDHHEALVSQLRTLITGFRPDLIAVTGPVEIHPDHRALARALIAVFQQRPSDAGHDAMIRIAFYEISQPFRPNTLIDISSVAEKKYAAILRHESQIAIRGYRDFAAGLNRYRSMTLDQCEYAEGYFVVNAKDLRLLPESELALRMMGIKAPVNFPTSVTSTSNISVVIRTRDRQTMLEEAIASVRRASLEAQIVVVDDGSTRPAVVPEDAGTALVRTEGVGRSEAMNRGVAEAGGEWIAFLDDDDLFFAEHLEVLAKAASSSDASVAGYYTDAVSTEYELLPSGETIAKQTLRTYARDFDRTRLLFDNYIPLNTLLVRRTDFLEVGGFDPGFDLFEDWDFLLRLTRKGPLRRIARVTCEVRHFAGSSSAVLAQRESSSEFRDAKIRIWQKHPEALQSDNLIKFVAGVKADASALFSETVDLRGRSRHLEGDVDRIDRERRQLLEAHDASDRRVADLSSRLDEAQKTIPIVADRIRTEMQMEINRAEGNAFELKKLLDDSHRVNRDREIAISEKDEAIETLYDEIRRLNGMLQTIYTSRTWRLHKLAERMRGRRA